MVKDLRKNFKISKSCRYEKT